MQERMVRSNVDVCFAGGVLNPQPLTSKILTPEGFKLISEIKAGDVICGIADELQHITHYDLEGEKDCVRITLVDGSSAESSLDHKWWCLRDNHEFTAISFELLESFQLAKEKGEEYNISIFRLIDGKCVPVKIQEVADIGKKEVACLGVSNEDELYITDDYLITKNCGKAQPLNALILTPNGFVRMGDVYPGMEICDTEGGTQKIVRVHEKNKRTIYAVEFDFGIVECCSEHLWSIYDKKRETIEILSTKELIDRKTEELYVLCPEAIEFKERNSDYPIPPYAFGRLLARERLSEASVGEELMAKLQALGIEDKMIIPSRYLYSPKEVRTEILRGFIYEKMQGHDNSGYLVFWIDEEVAIQFSLLLESLGGSIVAIGRSKECPERIRVFVKHAPINFLGKLGRNAERELKNQPMRRIYNIYPLRHDVARCIEVSNPNHLYITDYFIPTHNTFAAILMVAEPSLDANFRAVFTRRNLGNLKAGGGIIDDFTNAYGDYVSIKTSDNPRVQFPSGSFVDCIHIADESPSKFMERAKGWQYDLAYLDELTSYEFSTFSIIGTRVRGKGKWTGKIRGTTNPKRKHWTRKVLDWYIGHDGFIIPERDGVVRYYYQMGETVDDMVFGDSKEEVYLMCKPDIDRKLQKLAGKSWTYKDMVRSFVFYSGKMSENTASVGKNSSYIGAVAAVGGRRAQQLIEGNFNVDEDEDDKIPIPGREAQMVFVSDENRNGDKWITVDLADVGSDNLVALFWDGFHVDDIMILTDTTPRLNYERIKMFAVKHGVAERHIIYDATNGRYMYDYMPDAIPFVSASSAIGMQSLLASRLKDECYLRLCDVINKGKLSISEKVAKTRYSHKGISDELTVQSEFLEECAVVRFRELGGGKLKLLSKKEMNASLGRNRSMDVLDPCAMRMLPVLDRALGEELSLKNARGTLSSSQEQGDFDIYEDSSWF